MCGRAALGLEPDELQRATGARRWVDRDRYRSKYNVAPQSYNPVLRAASTRKRGDDGGPSDVVDVDVDEGSAAADDGEHQPSAAVRTLHQMKWGLMPSYEKELRKDLSTINARGETLESSRMWKRLLQRRRCVYYCEGFYEWYKTDEKSKDRKPYFLHLPDPGAPRGRRLLPMAGLYDVWQGPEGPLYTYTIVTTAACREILWLHDRMPVVLDPEDVDAWIDPSVPWEKVRDRLRARRDLQWYEVSTRVNGIKADDAELVRPASEAPRPRGIASYFAPRASPAKPKAEGAPPSPQASPAKAAAAVKAEEAGGEGEKGGRAEVVELPSSDEEGGPPPTKLARTS